MKGIILSPIAQVRLWYDDAPVPVYPAKGNLSGTASVAPGAIVARGTVGLEALIGRGAGSEYGLLAVSFKVKPQNALDIQVPFSEMRGPHWGAALGAPVDDVRLGLPEEYARPILDELSVRLAGRFPAGTVSIIRAAHGLVGSSQNLFRRLVHAIVELMLMQQSDIDHELHLSVLREAFELPKENRR